MTIAQEIEIRELRAELRDLREQALVQPFVDHLLGAIGVVLANTPYVEWPKFAREIFEQVARRHSVTATLYRERLPRLD